MTHRVSHKNYPKNGSEHDFRVCFHIEYDKMSKSCQFVTLTLRVSRVSIQLAVCLICGVAVRELGLRWAGCVRFGHRHIRRQHTRWGGCQDYCILTML